MVDLQSDGEGVLLPVQAQPKAKHNAVTGVHNGRLKVAVTQTPEKGKANAAIIKLLAKSLGLKRSQLEIIAGETSQKKTVRVRRMTVEALSRMIGRWA